MNYPENEHDWRIVLHFVGLLVVFLVSVAGICNSVGGGVFLTYHRGGGGGGRSNMHHALRVNHLSHSLPLAPHHNAHVNRRRRC